MAEAKDTIMKMLLSTPNPSQADIKAALKVKMDKTNIVNIGVSTGNNISIASTPIDVGTSKLCDYLERLNGIADIKAALKVKMDKTNIVNIGVSTGNNISIASTPIDVGTSKLCDYLERLNGIEEHVDLIYLDHCYTKPLNWRLENGYVKPTKTLFVTKPLEDVQCNNDDEIDVDGGNLNNVHPQPAYDSEKVTVAMNRIENHINILRQEAGEENWDLLIDRTGWTLAQNRIFDRTVRILHQDRLARLAYKGSWNEPVLRRISVNKSARRLRTLFSTFAWQTKLLQWLHCTLIDIMDTHNLTAYIDILQTLKEKVPELVERIFFCSNLQANKTNPEAVKALIKKPWDPSSNGLTCHIPNRLPGNPLIVIVPSGSPNNTNSPKIQRWYNHFSHIGTVVVVSTTGLNKSTALTSLEHMMASTRVKLSELKSEYPGKNIVLVGFNTGAALACQVALLEPVMAVICLGFPLNTVDEKRGQPDDNLLSMNVPVLFVIGQHAATSQVEDLEDLRERLRVENGLVIVGAADDCLRINKSKQSTEGITQAMLDRCIVDEIAEFIATLLLSPKNLKIDLAKSRLKVIEKKRKLVNDDLLAKTKGGNLPIGTKRIKTSLPKAISRPNKFTGQIIAEGPKKSVIQKDFIMTPRQTILSGNIRRLTSEPRVDQQLKILPKYKILKKEDLVDSLNTESLLDQLTPDRLLEMPVIIQDDSMEMAN